MIMWGLVVYLVIGFVLAIIFNIEFKGEIELYQEKLKWLMEKRDEAESFTHKMFYRKEIIELDKENKHVLDCLKGIELLGESIFYKISLLSFTLFWPVRVGIWLICKIGDLILFAWYDCCLGFSEWLKDKNTK